MRESLRWYLIAKYGSALLSNSNATVPHLAVLKTVKSIIQTFLCHWKLFDTRVDVVLCRKSKHSDRVLTGCTSAKPVMRRDWSIEVLLRNKIS